jgi:hypothetical protein
MVLIQHRIQMAVICIVWYVCRALLGLKQDCTPMEPVTAACMEENLVQHLKLDGMLARALAFIASKDVAPHAIQSSSKQHSHPLDSFWWRQRLSAPGGRAAQVPMPEGISQIVSWMLKLPLPPGIPVTPSDPFK